MKRQKEDEQAVAAGLEPPPRKQQKVRGHTALPAYIYNHCVCTSTYGHVGSTAPKDLLPKHSQNAPMTEANSTQSLSREPVGCWPLWPFTQTIENTRVKDETMVADGDEEVAADEEQDEFAGEWGCTLAHLRVCTCAFMFYQ